MKFRADHDPFMKFWWAIQPPPSEEFGELSFWDCEGILRLEARDGVVRARGPYGSAALAADIERPGVLFLPIKEFLQPTQSRWFFGDPDMEFEATDDYCCTRYMRFLGHAPWNFALFPDPATAPETWEPGPEPTDEEELEDEPTTT